MSTNKILRLGTQHLPYWLYRGHNDPWNNERMVELPLAWYFLDSMKRSCPYLRGMEIGAVTPYYPGHTPIGPASYGSDTPGLEDVIEVTPVFPPHLVVDPFDPHPMAQKVDIRDLNFKRHWVLSISTIEHVDHGEFGQKHDRFTAFSELLRIRSDAASYLVTWPTGYNADLDECSPIMDNWDDVILLQRTGYQEWVRVDSWGMYGSPEYNTPWPCGNGLYVMTNCGELLCRN